MTFSVTKITITVMSSLERPFPPFKKTGSKKGSRKKSTYTHLPGHVNMSKLRTRKFLKRVKQDQIIMAF